MSEPTFDTAHAMRERAAAAIDQLGDQTFARIFGKVGNAGVANLAQQHYLKCAAAIRDLAVDGDPPSASAGSAAVAFLDLFVDAAGRGIITSGIAGALAPVLQRALEVRALLTGKARA